MGGAPGCALTFPVPLSAQLIAMNRDAPSSAVVLSTRTRRGAAAVDLVIEQLHRNEFGLPSDPKLMLIASKWMDGKTVRRKLD
jgi:hypothetical protein